MFFPKNMNFLKRTKTLVLIQSINFLTLRATLEYE